MFNIFTLPSPRLLEPGPKGLCDHCWSAWGRQNISNSARELENENNFQVLEAISRVLAKGDGRVKSGLPDLFSSVLKTNRNTSEQIGTNRGIPENKQRKSEQIGLNPFCRPQTGGSEHQALETLASLNSHLPGYEYVFCNTDAPKKRGPTGT